ncbi:CDP-diacylglycerol---serine O-phosphatidyltransferase [Humidesulfovibrio mexicanus]|uniref:CDP-diacylglycerol--serine O-phosphatidyltransferase n=1 Tax=Humidesulfovibrio mexicanus TaxID=147047 RepID=A0A238Z8D0_9BACT|nr:CDP-diacylglycerol--serine O-phosphatidyltransferase [Humidesulfovibrio mexicanus]SNR79248.1 CDP-diacylglycerol---serine O-phosphatidyltransferase [Humidesulfovibrio mexicanus]
MAKEKALPRHKGVYILPNLFTAASLFLGFLGMVLVMEGRFEHTALCILGSCLFDGLDGKVARLTNTTSEFGVQFDSLADLVAFGAVPGLMMYQWQLSGFGTLGLMASFLLVACGALRLARFNVQSAVTSKKFFIGLPIPAQASTLATLVLFAPHLPEAWLGTVLPTASLVLVYILSFLMVSTMRYASFKEYGFIKAHPFSSMVTVILLFVMVASQPKMLGFVFFLGYILSGPIYTLFILSPRGSKMLAAKEQKQG